MKKIISVVILLLAYFAFFWVPGLFFSEPFTWYAFVIGSHVFIIAIVGIVMAIKWAGDNLGIE